MIILKQFAIADIPWSDRDAAMIIESIGRVSYKSEDKIAYGTAMPFVKKLIASGHESVLEHLSFTVHFVVDRGVSHELVRHRIASFTQESTRYCDYNKSGDIAFINPGLSEKSESFWIWRESCSVAEEYYKKLRERGVSPQIARSVLPNALKTELYMTANIREWRHFLTLRCAKGAHPQMREVALQLLDHLHKDLPTFFDDIWEQFNNN